MQVGVFHFINLTPTEKLYMCISEIDQVNKIDLVLLFSSLYEKFPIGLF